jgi:protein-L-isoaspartate(D-aspartate) O-methyltransferase
MASEKASEDHLRAWREAMVEHQLRARGIYDPRVLDAMRRIPRHEFVSNEFREAAYHDAPLPINDDQTISQPYIVALMTQALHLTGGETVLEVGTGSGYQTAILCELAAQVYSLERFRRLAARAGTMLNMLGYDNVEIYVGDGSQGLADMAPFDAIIVTAAAPALPGPLCTQLSPRGGRMVAPIGAPESQYLEYVVRENNRWEMRRLAAVRFVPLLGRYGFSGGADEDVIGSE